MMRRTMVSGRRWVAGAFLVVAAAACAEREPAVDGELSGTVELDGSSTVFPISEAVAEEFMAETGRSVRVTVASSGTGGGFKRFCAGETAISNASRPIKDSEREACAQAGVEYIEIPVAYDGITVVANPGNSFVQCLTVEELRRIWEPASAIRRWSEVREGWPNEEIHLYGPGTDSGTFDYFTEEVVGETRASRADFTASEDDNMLVQGVAGDPNAMGYFGFAYYEENAERLKPIAVDAGNGCVAPTRETIENGTYAPLSRPIFIYLSQSALQRPEVEVFVRYYLENASELVPQVGYVALDAVMYRENLEKVAQAAGGAI